MTKPLDFMKSKLILFLILTLPFFASAQQEVFKGEHFIEVTGTAHLEIEPNEIYTVIRLKEFEENRQKTSLESLDTDFLNALKQAGIDRKRLELADAGSRIGKFGRKDKDAFREKTYQLKLTSAAELEKFLEKLEPVKVDLVDVTRLHHTDYEKIKLDLKTKALQAARSKAETLLKSINAEIGKPLMVRDWEVDPIQPMMEMKAANVRMNYAADDAGQQEPIGFRKIKLQSQITAQFEIK
jgi:uncharacterized protein